MPRRFDKDRRNKYARSAQAWLALVAQATRAQREAAEAQADAAEARIQELEEELRRRRKQ